MKKISVLIPLYNHQNFISHAIESVLTQSFSDFELIIIDDCSTDNSAQIIKKYSQKDDRIKVFFNKKNLGVAKTRNKLIRKAKGKFIAFMDSDDIWYKTKLEKQLYWLKKNENLVVWTEGELINSKGEYLSETFSEKHNSLNKKKSGNIFNELLKGNFLFFSSIIVKRENIKNLRLNKNLRLLDDYQFIIDLSNKYDFKFINEPLVKYRIHNTNLIRSNFTRLLKELVIIYDYTLKNYNKNIPKNIKWILSIINFEILVFEKRYKLALKYLFQIIKIKPINSLSPLLYLSYILQKNSVINFLLEKKNINFRIVLFLKKLLFFLIAQIRKKKLDQLRLLQKKSNSNNLKLILRVNQFKFDQSTKN